MKTLKNWVLNHQAADHVELKVDDQHLFRIYVLGVLRRRLMYLGKGANVKAPKDLRYRRLSWSKLITVCVLALTACELASISLYGCNGNTAMRRENGSYSLPIVQPAPIC